MMGGLVDDLDAAFLARHWMMLGSMDDDDNRRETVFAEVGSKEDRLGWLDE